MVNYFYQCVGFTLERGREKVTAALMYVSVEQIVIMMIPCERKSSKTKEKGGLLIDPEFGGGRRNIHANRFAIYIGEAE